VNNLTTSDPSVLGELRRLVALAWPVVIGQLGMMTMNVVDALMVGRLGEEALAGVALGNTWAFMGLILGFGTAFGIDPLLSQARGAGDTAGYERALRNGAALLTLLSLGIMVQHLLTEPALRSLQQPGEVIPIASGYATALAAGVWPMLLFLLVKQAVQARGIMRPAMWVVLAANLVNVVANVVFMYGIGSWEGMGAVGSGWATSLSRWFMLAMLLAGMPEERRALLGGWYDVSWATVRRVAGTAVPSGLVNALEVWAFSLSTVIMGWLGPTSVAAHTVALNLASIAFMVPLGLGAAASARVGNLIGAGQPWGRAAWVAIGAGAASMTVSAAIFTLWPEPLARAYLPDSPEALLMAASLVPLAALFQVFDGTQVVCFGVLRGAGDTRLAAAANLFAYYFVGLPLGAWLALRGGWGPRGVWVGLIVSLVVVSVLLVARVRYVMERGVERVRA
jgi:MATE family multidrug resistance protein